MNEKDPFECTTCNTVEVGTLIRDDDTRVTLEIRDDEAISAQDMFSKIEQRALAVGSGNCKIQSETCKENGMTVIKAMLDFDCTAEKLIFEMSQR
ncbi:DUF406 family protein [Endozoicomonas numazuensis]|uniref:DUF406 family protein n=1 Tax=Endozoicomonas numazuensis TaxID=1137799 RepID=A0A081NKI6_9GAMM|nr:DUF406 family protein [Endozoicomonas numazuensis]KEQ18959.1 hypothetical protein GZ78_02595 [Endozoicomonas numazuensis]